LKMKYRKIVYLELVHLHQNKKFNLKHRRKISLNNKECGKLKPVFNVKVKEFS